jgi:hypothetical protein
MKRHFHIPFAILMLLGVLTVGAQAQTNNSHRVIANIPFSFNVGEKRLPAGKYTITVVNPSSDRRILQVRSTDGRSSAMVQTTTVQSSASDDTKLVFHRYGDRYFFAQAQMAGDLTSLAALKSNAERAQKQTVAANKKSVIVIVAG